jgi:hypothetical protein
VSGILDEKEPLAREVAAEVRSALQQVCRRGRQRVELLQVSECRNPVSKRPVVAVGDPGRLPGTVGSAVELAGEQVRERPVGIKRPPLRIVGAGLDSLFELGYGFIEAPFVREGVAQAAERDGQGRVQLGRRSKLCQRLVVCLAGQQRAAPRSALTRRTSSGVALNENVEVRVMTSRERCLDSALMMSSVMPSAKYSCFGSPPWSVNGSTATIGLPGERRPSCASARATASDSGAMKQ